MDFILVFILAGVSCAAYATLQGEDFSEALKREFCTKIGIISNLIATIIATVLIAMFSAIF